MFPCFITKEQVTSVNLEDEENTNNCNKNNKALKIKKEEPDTNKSFEPNINNNRSLVCTVVLSQEKIKELTKIQQEMLATEINFTKIVEDDRKLRDEMFDSTRQLKDKIERLSGLLEVLALEKLNVISKNNNSTQTDHSFITNNVKTINSVIQQQSLQQSSLKQQNTFNQIDNNRAVNSKLKLIKENETLLELILLDFELRSIQHD